MTKVIISMALGFFLKKINILSDAAVKGFSLLIVHVTAPCLLFSSIVTMDSSEIQNALTLMWTGVIVYAALIILAILVIRLLKFPVSSRGVYEAAMIFGNVSFLGIPVASSLYGSLGVFYIALLNIHFNVLFYSMGLYMIMKSGEKTGVFSPRRLINTGLVSISLATLIFFLQIKLPDAVIEPVAFAGSITSPLSMIVIGCSAASYSLKKVFTQKKIYILSVLRLIIYPIAAFCILKPTLGDSILTRVICIYIGMPTASVVGMTALAYNADSESATSCVAMTTILSLVTIPALYMAMAWI